VLALYTDGLVEEPGQEIDAGMTRLARTLTTSLERSLDHARDAILGSRPGASDDIALLLAPTARPPPRGPGGRGGGGACLPVNRSRFARNRRAAPSWGLTRETGMIKFRI